MATDIYATPAWCQEILEEFAASGAAAAAAASTAAATAAAATAAAATAAAATAAAAAPASAGSPGPTDAMALAIRIARANVEHGGGPFGAVVTDADGRLIEVGWNMVIDANDSTAHAEVVALRRAMRRLGVHTLPSGTVLESSCAPCIQCYGAIYWSGVTKVRSAATKQQAESLGFDEGPVTDDLWKHALAVKNIHHESGVGLADAALEPLRAYQARGGPVY